MKKILTISVIAVMLIIMSVTGVNAVTNADLASTVYSMCSKYGMTSSDKLKAERYLNDYPVTDPEAESIVANVQKAVNIMEKAGVTDYSQLTEDKKAEIRSLAYTVADILNVELVIKNGRVDVYKDGKLIESVGKSGGTLAYTGNNNLALIISSIAVIALALVVARKKIANE